MSSSLCPSRESQVLGRTAPPRGPVVSLLRPLSLGTVTIISSKGLHSCPMTAPGGVHAPLSSSTRVPVLTPWGEESTLSPMLQASFQESPVGHLP